MRIAVDVSCLANGRGFGRFTRETMRVMVALAPGHEFWCIGDASAFEAFALDAPNVRHLVVPQAMPPTVAAGADRARSFPDLWRMTRATSQLRPDVFWSPSVYTFFPLRPGQRAVVTLHDAIADRFPQLTLPTARARWFWRLKVAVALRQARLVLTVSEYAASQVAETHHIPLERIRVAVEAPSDAFRPATSDEVALAATAAGVPGGSRWFTYVGGFSPHKRLDVVLQAHAALRDRIPDPPHLVLVGRLTGDAFLTSRDSLVALADQLGTTDLIHWTGFLPDETVAALHTGAIATLLVSESEGFGLPAVEAAACGCPVIASTESPLPRLLHGGGCFVRPGDAGAVSEAMVRLSTDEAGRHELGRAARERASRLTWHATASATLATLEEAAA